MATSIVCTTDPNYAENPIVQTADFKLHARITTTSEDTLIAFLIETATRMAEKQTNRSLGSQQWKLSLDAFPYMRNEMGLVQSAPIRLLKSPVASIDSVTYIDGTGTEQTMVENTDFLFDADSLPPRLVPPYGQDWPDAQNYYKTVVVNYTTGYPSGEVPAPILQAIRMMATTWYENRDSLVFGPTSELPVPYIASALLKKYALERF